MRGYRPGHRDGLRDRPPWLDGGHGWRVPTGRYRWRRLSSGTVGWQGGPAPARIYIPELLGDVLSGAINPGLVLDYETDLDHVADAYAAMDERRAIKSLIRVGTL